MKKEISFEHAMERLDDIVASLGEGDIPLEDSLRLYGEGAELLALCENKLKEAKLTIETLFPEENTGMEG